MLNSTHNTNQLNQIFTRHFTPKMYQASVLRPGKKSGETKDGVKWACPRKPSCTEGQAISHASISRNIGRREGFLNAMYEINRVAGGDPRRIRRAMARALAKRGRTA